MKKWIVWFLALSLLLPALPGAVRAEEAPVSSPWSLEDRWDLSLDGETLTCGNRVYHRYLLPPGEYFRPALRLIHEVDIPTYTGASLELVTAEGNEDYVFLCDYAKDLYPIRVYVTDAGARQLDRWCRGAYSRMTLLDVTSNPDQEAPLPENLAAQLDAAPITAEIDVMTLQDVPRYRIMVHDETGNLQHPHGEIYLRHDGYYYVNLDALDNTCFDAEGNLSYRSGTVPMAHITGILRQDVAVVLDNREEISYPYEYLSDYLDDGSEQQGDPTALLLILTVISLLLGFLLPAALLIVALVKALSKKAAGRRRWYLLMALATAWIGYALYIMISLVT